MKIIFHKGFSTDSKQTDDFLTNRINMKPPLIQQSGLAQQVQISGRQCTVSPRSAYVRYNKHTIHSLIHTLDNSYTGSPLTGQILPHLPDPRIPHILSGIRGSGGVTRILDKALSSIRGLVCTGRPVYGNPFYYDTYTAFGAFSHIIFSYYFLIMEA